MQNRQGDVKNSVENGKAKELICTNHGQKLRVGIAGGKGCYQAEGGETGTTIIASSVKYI